MMPILIYVTANKEPILYDPAQILYYFTKNILAIYCFLVYSVK